MFLKSHSVSCNQLLSLYPLNPFVSHHSSRIANGFTDVVKSLVSDILLPPIALLPFINRNMHEKFFVLRRGPNYPYNTLKQAAEDGAVTMAWG